MLRKNRYRLALTLLVLAGVTIWMLHRGRQAGAGLPPLHTVEVDRGDISQRIVAHGRLQPVQMITVGSQVSGMVQEIDVDFNSLVRQGQVIARLDPSTFEAEVRSAEAQYEASVAGLDLARLQWDRVQTLRENRVVPLADVDQARANLRQAEAQLQVRGHALDRAQRELDRCIIRSPTDGIVIARNIDVGQTVAASLTSPNLFTIAADLSRMQIHANVSEADIGSVREGMPVRFLVDAHRERTFHGELIQVRNAPRMESNVVHYETIIAVDNEERLLKPGMTAEVSIITDEVTDAVRVRNAALRARLPDELRPPDPEPVDGAGGRVVVMQDGQLTSRAVRTGLTDGFHTQIVSGLDPGETLVIGLLPRTDNDSGGRSLLRGTQAQF